MTKSIFGLEGKKILVLGGGRGMGESTSLFLAKAGCNVVVLDIVKERADSVAAAVGREGVRGWSYSADVFDDAALTKIIPQIDSEVGGLDGMATVIGMAAWSSLLDMTMETWDLDHRRNLRYFLLAAKTVAACLIKRKAPGSIVCIASVDGLQSAPYHASYGAAKAGLVNLVRSMAAEWSPRGIRINCIAPAMIITPRLPVLSAEEELTQTRVVPLRRRGTTDEIGKAALFLLSDMASFVNGQTLPVDGGFSALGAFDYESQLEKVPTGGTHGGSK